VHVSQAAKCDEEEKLRRELSMYKDEARRYCLTTDCVRTTHEIARRMDDDVDECDDFWRYACGGWLRDNARQPLVGDAWGVEHEMAASVQRYVRRQLETAADCDDERMTTDCKMRLLYARCTDTQTVDAVGTQPLQDILDDLGGWSALGLLLLVVVYFFYRATHVCIARCRLAVCHCRAARTRR